VNFKSQAVRRGAGRIIATIVDLRFTICDWILRAQYRRLSISMERAIALITGASGGIGRACALALAGRTAGFQPAAQNESRQDACATNFDLALQYQKNTAPVEALAAQLRGAVRAETFQSDLSKPGEAAALVERVAEKLGPPTVLIHAAGHIVEKPLGFTTPADWDALLEVHAVSGAILAKAMLRHLRKSEQGRIVFIGSLAGVTGLGNAAAYAAAKGALSGLCKSLALEVARWQATVNVIAPGYVDTAMTSGHDGDKRAQVCQNIPLGRYGRPEDIAGLAAFLCSPHAGYITGQTIVVDGGMSLG
jgi:3-oxoacyl-[acyl-carrier protein] reductase